MKYLQERFAKTSPQREKCKKLNVIRNIKCMDQQSIDAFNKILRELKNPNNACYQFVKNNHENATGK